MVEVKIVHLTPELAMEWREKNTNNFRKINPRKVSEYTHEIESGNWKLNGETIQFYEDGTLANGQHRIEGVIKANRAIDVVVVEGIKRDVSVFDSGLTRTTAQIAKSMGLSAHNTIFATVSFFLNEGSINTHGKAEIIEYYLSHQEYFDMASALARRGSKLPILYRAGSVAAIYCCLVLKEVSYDKLEAFCSIVNSGMPYFNYVMEPAVVLRNMLVNHELGVHSSNKVLAQTFNVTWQALERFNRQIKLKKRYNAKDNYMAIISLTKESG